MFKRILNETESAIKLWEIIKSVLSIKERSKNTLVSTRLIQLLTAHGIHRNQIPRFLGNGLTLADVQTDEIFLSKLNEQILNDVCCKFGIQREWLDGANSQIYPVHDFYKRPEDFESFICEITSNNPKGKLSGVVIAPNESGFMAYGLILLKEIIDYIGEKEIYRYHICNNWAFSYWKARAYMAACIAVAWRKEVYIRGVYAPAKQIDKIIAGKKLLNEDTLNMECKRWYPEDMALCPEKFLDGIDPEIDDFGIRSGLELWLELDKKGFMDTKLRESPRRYFKNKLDEIKFNDVID